MNKNTLFSSRDASSTRTPRLVLLSPSTSFTAFGKIPPEMWLLIVKDFDGKTWASLSAVCSQLLQWYRNNSWLIFSGLSDKLYDMNIKNHLTDRMKQAKMLFPPHFTSNLSPEEEIFPNILLLDSEKDFPSNVSSKEASCIVLYDNTSESYRPFPQPALKHSFPELKALIFRGTSLNAHMLASFKDSKLELLCMDDCIFQQDHCTVAQSYGLHAKKVHIMLRSDSRCSFFADEVIEELVLYGRPPELFSKKAEGSISVNALKCKSLSSL